MIADPIMLRFTTTMPAPPPQPRGGLSRLTPARRVPANGWTAAKAENPPAEPHQQSSTDRGI